MNYRRYSEIGYLRKAYAEEANSMPSGDSRGKGMPKSFLKGQLRKWSNVLQNVQELFHRLRLRLHPRHPLLLSLPPRRRPLLLLPLLPLLLRHLRGQGLLQSVFRPELKWAGVTFPN